MPLKQKPSRRDLISLAGSAAALSFLGCRSDTLASNTPTSPTSPSTSTSSCSVKPQLTEGPYFVDERLNRSDIRANPIDGAVKPGVLLQLTVRVSQITSGSCTPLAGAFVDVWHCDALGIYSDVSDMGFNAIGSKFLRGYQVTDSTGSVQFTTIYPGWYAGRAVHIHFKIRNSLTASSSVQFTSQWFFDESLTDVVHAQSPYSGRGRRNTLNQNDGIYTGGGSQLVLALAPNAAGGYAGTFDVTLQL